MLWVWWVLIALAVGVPLAAAAVWIMGPKRQRAFKKPFQESDDSTPGAPPALEQHVFIMRHAEREDDIDAGWARTAERPFDTPISAAGKTEARAAGERLRRIAPPIRVVVTSPFLRCVQTAVAVCEGMNYGTAIVVDNGLSEVHSACTMKGADISKPAALGLPGLASLFPGRLRANPKGVPMPEWGEEKGAGGSAYERFVGSLQRLAAQYHPDPVLLVTHGDAVAACVGAVLPPGSMVYKTDYCCCAHLVLRTTGWEIMDHHDSGIEWIGG
jgi:broad specificity phosphatase PhoE